MSKTVLVVDDEPMTRDLLRLMLERVNFKVIEAEDGMDAIEKAKTMKPDAIILDVMMPRMDGYAVCKTLRSEEETEHLPVLMLSAKTSPAAIEQGFAAGATKYLSKPIGHKQLVAHVNEVLDNISIQPSQ